jgi:hypothetical protein
MDRIFEGRSELKLWVDQGFLCWEFLYRLSKIPRLHADLINVTIGIEHIPMALASRADRARAIHDETRRRAHAGGERPSINRTARPARNSRRYRFKVGCTESTRLAPRALRLRQDHNRRFGDHQVRGGHAGGSHHRRRWTQWY